MIGDDAGGGGVGETLAEILAGGDGPFTRRELHGLLDGLLDSAEGLGGCHDPKEFWKFVTAVAHGRGIAEHLDAAGAEAENEVPDGNAKTRDRRRQRAYLIGVVQRLIADTGENGLLPQRFDHVSVAFDLGHLLGGNRGEGSATPRIFYAGSRSDPDKAEERQLREFARVMLVAATLYRAAANRTSQAAAWRELMGHRDEKHLWDRWKKKALEANEALLAEAEAAGKRRDEASHFHISDDQAKYWARLALTEGGEV